MFVYSLDELDPVFSHQVSILRKLSPYFSTCTVFTFQNSHDMADLPLNVKAIRVPWSSTFKINRVFNLLRLLFKEVWGGKPNLVFSFMTETQSAIVGPFLRIFRVPQVLWYAHQSNSLRFKLAHIFSSIVLTSTAGSIPRVTSKVKVVGQMIDSEKFIFKHGSSPKDTSELKLVHVGRLDPSKNIGIICQVFEQINNFLPNSTLHFYGKASIKHKERLETTKSAFSDAINNKRIVFHGSLHREKLPSMLSSFDFFIHGYEGSLDKSLIEATMVGVPVITCNVEYHREFGLWNSKTQNAGDVSEILLSEFEGIKRLNKSELLRILENRRLKAVACHSLEHWAQSVVTILHTSKIV